MTDAILDQLGWSHKWEQKRLACDIVGEPARVIRHDAVKVVVATGAWTGHVTFSRAVPLAVGDWVLVGDETVKTLLPRENVLERDNGEFGTQVIGANIDLVVVVLGADRPLRQRKIMRYAAFAGDIGATPIVVVAKTDLVDNVGPIVDTVSFWLPGIPILETSVETGEGLGRLFDVLAARTGTFIGESGAGKSSLVNALMKDEVAWIGDVREKDAKGRHTTTHRELHRLPGGGIVIDNPGIRSLGLAADGEGVETMFSDIEELSASCRFRDCAHRSEPGCSVTAAIASGELTDDRYTAYLHFVAEQATATSRAVERDRDAVNRREANAAQQARDATTQSDPDLST